MNCWIPARRKSFWTKALKFLFTYSQKRNYYYYCFCRFIRKCGNNYLQHRNRFYQYVCVSLWLCTWSIGRNYELHISHLNFFRARSDGYAKIDKMRTAYRKYYKTIFFRWMRSAKDSCILNLLWGNSFCQWTKAVCTYIICLLCNAELFDRLPHSIQTQVLFGRLYFRFAGLYFRLGCWSFGKCRNLWTLR